jgi:tetratricopeptide (TPR) repeat protein
VERGDLAILFFTNTPLVSAHLFRRFPDGWRLDIAAEIQDTREFVGGPFTWGMMLTGDDYSSAFSDLFADFGPMGGPASGYRAQPTRLLRPARGDNRPLPTRKGHDPAPARIRIARPPGLARLLLPQVGTRTEDFGYPTQTIDRLAVRRLLMSRSYDTLDLVLSAYADSVVRDYRLEYRLFDAYAAFGVAMPVLESRLNEWVAQRPSSAAALISRGTFFSASGWNARGAKSARETGRDRFHKMDDFFRRASSDLNAALRLAPNSIVAYRELISINFAESDLDTSRQLLDKGLKIQPYSFRLRVTYMHNLLPRWGGSYDEMARFAEESARYAARNPRLGALRGFVDWDRGRILEAKGLKAQAIKAYDRALAFGDFWQFRYDRGDLYFHNHQELKAVEDLDRVLVQNPQNTDALYDRSWASYNIGLDATGEARRHYLGQAFDDAEMAVALDPMDTYYREHLAFVRENIPEYAPPPPQP